MMNAILCLINQKKTTGGIRERNSHAKQTSSTIAKTTKRNSLALVQPDNDATTIRPTNSGVLQQYPRRQN